MKESEAYIYQNQKKLRRGYTTGSCAAAASKAAALTLFSQNPVSQVSLMTPKGIELTLEVVETCHTGEQVRCAVRKDGGDDPDVTHGVLVWAGVTLTQEPGIVIDGGEGVGRVTRKGLDQPVGAAAINSTPRRMIEKEVLQVCRDFGYHGGVKVEISIPAGVELARKTFNPRLGIEGGISVLGTSGIVEPMSEKALIDTIHVEMRVAAASGVRYLLATPGNYGQAFTKGQMHLDLSQAVKFSNYLGELLDYTKELSFDGLLIVSHIGKMVKAAGGIMNTHSHTADCRMEILTAHAAMAGADQALCQKLMECITTDEALELLKQHHLLEPVMETVACKMEQHLKHRLQSSIPVGAVFFSNEYGLLGMTSEAPRLIDLLQAQSQSARELAGRQEQE